MFNSRNQIIFLTLLGAWVVLFGLANADKIGKNTMGEKSPDDGTENPDGETDS
jgi:hypothetical protein